MTYTVGVGGVIFICVIMINCVQRYLTRPLEGNLFFFFKYYVWVNNERNLFVLAGALNECVFLSKR